MVQIWKDTAMLMREVDGREESWSVLAVMGSLLPCGVGRVDRALGCGYFGLWSAVKHTFWRLVVHAFLRAAACLPTNTRQACLYVSPFEPLSHLWLVHPYLSLLLFFFLFLFSWLHLDSERAFAFVASFTPSCPGCSCIVGGFLKVQSRVRYSGPVHSVRLHFGLLEHAPSSHRISRDTHTLQDAPTVHVLSPRTRRLFSRGILQSRALLLARH
jgi:hypothetical protein